MTKLEKILELQEKGLNLEEIAKEVGYKNIDSMNKYMNKQGYSKQNNIYILKEQEKAEGANEEMNIENNQDLTQDLTTETTETIEKTELQQIKEQMKNIERWCMNEKYSYNLKVEPKALDLKNTSVRVDKKALEKFDKVAEKYSSVNKAYLLSKALEEFADKYL